jgi:hypothetical protein
VVVKAEVKAEVKEEQRRTKKNKEEQRRTKKNKEEQRRTRKTTLRSEGRSALKKYLTEPTLLEMSGTLV